MKIISVRFANLNSLPGPYLIRFDAAPLADTGLFAITGPTGAGKSTLLDAIAVGLYGRVPRHDRQVGEMVSRQAEYAFSEVEFEVLAPATDGGDGQRVRYRARWEVRRKKRGEDKGSLNQDVMTLALSATNQTLVSGKELVPARVGELSGLDFGQFEQAVLLSQGKFARFLHAPERERSALLEKMTNVGIYSRLSVAAFDKAKQEELITKLLRARLAAARLLTDDERQALETQLAALHDAAEGHYQEQQELSVFLTWRTLLDELDRRQARAEREWHQLEKAGHALAPDLARLARHEQAAALATPLALAAAAAHALLTNQTDRAALDTAHPALAAAAAAAEADAATAAAAHRAAEAEEARLRPVLAAAREADALLAAAARNLAAHTERHAQARHDHTQRQSQWHAEATEIAQRGTQETDLTAWLLAHNHEAGLPGALGTIKDELLDLGIANTQVVRLATRQQEQVAYLRTVVAERQAQRHAAAQALVQARHHAALARPLHAERHALLDGNPPAALAQRHAGLTARFHLGQRLLPLAQTVADQTRRAETTGQELAAEALALQTADTAADHLSTRRDDAQRLLDSYRRELRAHQALADLNAHRQHLRPGEPCPLCGALDHALTADFQPDDAAPEQRVQAQQTALKALEAALETAREALVRRRSAQQQRHERRAEATAAAQAARDQATALATDVRPLLPHPTDPAAVQQHLAETAAALAVAAAQTGQLARLDEALLALHTAHDQAATAALHARSRAALADERRTHAQQTLALLKSELATAREQVANYAAVVQGFLQPHGLALAAEADPAGLLSTLQARAETFESQQNSLNALRLQLTQQRSRHQAQAEDLAQQAAVLAAAAATLAADANALDQQRAARHAAYAGPDPAAAQEALRQRVHSLAAVAQAAAAQARQHQQAAAENRSLAAQLVAQAGPHRTAHATRQATLAAALAAAGLPDAAAAQARLLPAAEAAHLAQRRQQHRLEHEAARLLVSKLAVEAADYHAHALTPHSAVALAAQLKALAAADDRLQQQLGAVGNQLDRDDQTRREQAEGQQELALRQQEEQRWQDLSEQIGSAKGDKFSQFAQGLTLAHLARLANLRLRQLTGRYTILKTPNRDLELQIVDHDQAGAVRPMASLSGGESFLVSLALALGLSELAGHKARIESLFIDEGFGTLDPEALDTALDALERLQHSGKMIGIISHVTGLKERIGTQIRVRPGPGGTSTVHVVDARGRESSCAAD